MRTLLLLAALAVPCAASEEEGRVLLLDFDGDGSEDRAELIQSAESGRADLGIATARQTYIYHELVFSGAMEGQVASLAPAPEGGLQVLSGNRSMGRSRWDQTLTIVWKDEDFRLAGVSRSWWDTLTPDADGHCDVDFLTGHGLGEGSEGAVEIRLTDLAPSLEHWSRELPEGCEG